MRKCNEKKVTFANSSSMREYIIISLCTNETGVGRINFKGTGAYILNIAVP